jgi:hypothetical protein
MAVCVYKIFKDDVLNKIFWLRVLTIHPKYRNQGYSKQIIRYLSKDCDVIGLTGRNPYIFQAVKSVAKCNYNYYFNSKYLKNIVKISQIGYLQNKSIHFTDTYAIIDTQNYVKKMDSVKDIMPFGSQLIGIYKIKKNIKLD